MRHDSTILFALLLLLLPLSTRPVHAQDPLTGDWAGRLTVPGGMQLRLVFHIGAEQGGQREASLDSPDQGAMGMPVQSVTLDGDSVRIAMPAIAGSFEGRLAADGQRIEGMWRQGGGAMPLVLEKSTEAIEPPRRPQNPEPPFPYRAEDVSYANPAAEGVTLAGTLTLPEGSGPFPAVVLVSGSGPQNRDEELLGHKPFLVLSDALTRRGIAVLRFDDRGVAQSTGTFATATSEDFASDALAGIRYLANRPEIDAARIGIVGHSEGGLIAPIVAASSEDVAFIVMMAGPGVSGSAILEMQGELIARANGASEEMIAATRDSQRRIFDLLRTTTDSAAAHRAVLAEMRRQMEALTPQQRQQMGVDAAGGPDAFAATQAAQITSPWFRYFLTYDPATSLRRVTVPVLAVIGELDLQVPPQQNIEPIRAALAAAGNTDVTVTELPGLNHLFQPATTGSPAEYAQIETTMSDDATRMIADWILERFGPGR